MHPLELPCRALVSTTFELSLLPPGPTLATVQPFSPICLSLGVLLRCWGNPLICQPQAVISQRRTPYFIRTECQLESTAISTVRHTPMISIALIHLMRLIFPNIDEMVEAFVDSSVNPKRPISFPVLDIRQAHE